MRELILQPLLLLLLLVIHLVYSGQACNRNQFTCANGECIPKGQQCDGHTQCSDESDESHCHPPCSIGLFQCANGNCVSQFFVCDDHNDCADWSDESNCTKSDLARFRESSSACPSDQFKCPDSFCVPLSWRCDGRRDCQDGSDELSCNSTKACDGFRCGSHCILPQWVCDGEKDCDDGTDEIGCGPDVHLNKQCLPEHGWYSCTQKGKMKCIPITHVCDKYPDCDDGGDEGGSCNVACTNQTCATSCHSTPHGPVCSCPTGFRLNGTTCLDIDECAINPPVCSQQCTNTNGGYICSCSPNYALDQDSHTCTANGPEALLFFSTREDIRSQGLLTKDYKLVHHKVYNVYGLDSSTNEKSIYWTNMSPGDSAIHKSYVGAVERELVVSVGVNSPEDLAIDWLTRHVYFTDSAKKHIVVCDFHGSMCAVVVSTNLDKPRGIAVDPEKHLVFWTDWGSKPHIGSAGMDGSNPTDIVKTDIGWPNGITVDDTVHRVFWCDAKLHRIESSRYDGTDRQILPVAVNHPYFIDVFEDTVFWTDPVEHEILSCNKFNGKNLKALVKEPMLQPYGIHIMHPSKQTEVINPCWHSLCSHLCLLSPSISGYRCSCPIGMSLTSDNRTCTQNPGEPFMIAASTNELHVYYHQLIGKDTSSRSASDIGNIGAMVYDFLHHSIIYSDLVNKKIQQIHVETFESRLLFDKVNAAEGIDVDPYTGNIYWTDVVEKTLVVGNSGERVVLARKLDNPTCMALAVELGYVYVVEGNVVQTIKAWYTDGTSNQVVVKDITGRVSSLAYDHKRRELYWSNFERGTIEKVGIDDYKRVEVRSHLGFPLALAIDNDNLFWLVDNSDRIFSINTTEIKKPSSSKAIDPLEYRPIQYRKLVVVRAYNYSNSHSCHEQGGGCEKICTHTPEGAKCLCPLGSQLGEDGHTCRKIKTCGSSEIQCRSGSCIPSSLKCDGVLDCIPSGDDESNCSNETLICSGNKFRCTNGQCINKEYLCDGDFDCFDHSDEPASCNKSCGKDEFSCKNHHQCVPQSTYCDGERDCRDGTDELNCTKTDCRPSEFLCKQSQRCISQLWVCDGDKDCQHGEDEENCTREVPCPPNHIRCPVLMDCIPKALVCNGAVDCDRSSPQEICSRLPANFNLLGQMTTRRPNTRPMFTCPLTEFTCHLSSYECIPANYRCNCKEDCPNGEDEEGCPPCGSDLFRCKDGKQISNGWVCDGISDCIGGDDEQPGECSRIGKRPSLATLLEIPHVPTKCQGDDFTCKNGQCISLMKVCDTVPDCIDGTDEGRNCSTSCTNNGGCPQLCIHSPDQPICQCNSGFQSLNNGRECVDINECGTNDQCSQLCINTKGSYRCDCVAGYELGLDHRTCKAKDGPTYLFASSQQRVMVFTSESAPPTTLLQSDIPIKDISYIHGDQIIYYVLINGVIYSKKFDDQGEPKLVYHVSKIIPTGMAVDYITSNIYISGYRNNSINGSEIRIVSPVKQAEVFLMSTSKMITDLALDSGIGVMFWLEWQSHTGKIRRSAMDGTTQSDLSKVSKIAHPVSLAIDTVKQRIYWIDMQLHTISSCDYHGNYQQEVVPNTNRMPLSLTLFQSKLSWVNDGSNKIYSMHPGQAVSSVNSSDVLLQIVNTNSVLQPKSHNPCANSLCNNGVCILSTNLTYRCLCPEGQGLQSQNPFKCVGVAPSHFPNVPIDSQENVASTGATVGTILICLGILTVLGILGWMYYTRWRRTVGSPLKFRFRNALGLGDESTAWEESVDYSDRKILHDKRRESLVPDISPQFLVDRNDNQKMHLPTDSAYASQQSLVKVRSIEEIPQQLLPVSYSMKDKLLASEL